MAGRDYTWLLAAVADELHRADLTARIPDWIVFAEATINRKLNIYAKEIEAPLTTEIASRFIPLPDDYGSPLRLEMRDIEPRSDIIAVEATQLSINDDAAGIPIYWAIDGANIAFDRPADKSYPLMFRYVESLNLSSTNLTNPILLKNPDLYLYGSLLHSAPYIKDDMRIGTWKAMFDDALRQVAAEASRSKSVAPLRTELPISLIGTRRTTRGWGY